MFNLFRFCHFGHLINQTNKMKKILLSLMIAGAGLAASAQTSPVKFGVKAGVNFPSVSFSEVEEDEGKVKANTSFYLGGTVDFQISEMFSVQPGLLLSGKGYKQELSGTEEGVTFSAKSSRSLMYIEIPVNAVVSFPAGSGKVFIGAGPYYAMAISGKDKAEFSLTGGGVSESESDSDDVDFSKDGDTKRGDFGINALAGYQLSNGFNIHAGYGFGLSNVARDSGDFKVKNKVFSIGIGFSF